MSAVRKIVLLDMIGDCYEPYDRRFMLQMTYEFCCTNASIIRNVSVTYLRKQIQIGGSEVVAPHISFEIDEVTERKWAFLLNSIGSWAVRLEVLPEDSETAILYPSEFK